MGGPARVMDRSWHVQAGWLRQCADAWKQGQAGDAREHEVPEIWYFVVDSSGEKCGESNLEKQLLTFPAGFSIDFAYGKLAEKLANGNHVTMVHCNGIIVSWVS